MAQIIPRSKESAPVNELAEGCDELFAASLSRQRLGGIPWL